MSVIFSDFLLPNEMFGYAENTAVAVRKTWVLEHHTGWSILFLYTLTCSYDKNGARTKEIVVDIFSVYQGISFDSKKSEKITDISFHNRNNRNNKNNRNKLQKMVKMVSFLLSTKLYSLSVI